MGRAVRIVFGAHGQLVVGVLLLATSIAAWAWGSLLSGQTLIRFIFHVSMAALVFAAYSIIATSLGYRATERVEAKVVETVEQTDTVEINES